MPKCITRCGGLSNVILSQPLMKVHQVVIATDMFHHTKNIFLENPRRQPDAVRYCTKSQARDKFIIPFCLSEPLQPPFHWFRPCQIRCCHLWPQHWQWSSPPASCGGSVQYGQLQHVNYTVLWGSRVKIHSFSYLRHVYECRLLRSK